MKNTLFALFAAAAIGLSITALRADPPIVVPTPSPVPPGTSTTTTTTTVETSPGIWVTVPEEYEGDYFIYNNHYYHGGRYERGDFTWEGHHYDGRYFHDGKWIYGGRWEHHHGKERR